MNTEQQFISDRRPPEGERGMCVVVYVGLGCNGWQLANDGVMNTAWLDLKTAMADTNVSPVQTRPWRWATVIEMEKAGATHEQAREMAHPSMLIPADHPIWVGVDLAVIEKPLSPEIRFEHVIVGANCHSGHHTEEWGDRYFFDGGDDEGYEEAEDAEEALAAYKATAKGANAEMIRKDGPAKPATVITPAPTFYDQPRNDGLLTLAPMGARAGANWGA